MIDYLTLAVTFLLGILGLIVNSLLQRRNNSINTITRTRIEAKEKLQKCMKDILMLSNVHYLNTWGDEKEKNKMIRKLAGSVSELRSLLCYSFEIDKKVCKKSEEILEAVDNYLINGTTVVELNELRAQFEALIDPYIQTEWRRIKTETVGNKRKGLGTLTTWTDDYKDYMKYYKKWNEKEASTKEYNT